MWRDVRLRIQCISIVVVAVAAVAKQIVVVVIVQAVVLDRVQRRAAVGILSRRGMAIGVVVGQGWVVARVGHGRDGAGWLGVLAGAETRAGREQGGDAKTAEMHVAHVVGRSAGAAGEVATRSVRLQLSSKRRQAQAEVPQRRQPPGQSVYRALAPMRQ